MKNREHRRLFSALKIKPNQLISEWRKWVNIHWYHKGKNMRWRKMHIHVKDGTQPSSWPAIFWGQRQLTVTGFKFLSSRRRKICWGRSRPLSTPLHGKVDVLAVGVSLLYSQDSSCGVVCCFYSCLGKLPFIPIIIFPLIIFQLYKRRY